MNVLEDLIISHSSFMRRFSNNLECAICLEPIKIAMMSPCCSTNYCSACIRMYLTVKSECPHCRKSLTSVELKNNRILDSAAQAFDQLSASWDELCRALKYGSNTPLPGLKLEELTVEGGGPVTPLTKEHEILKQKLISSLTAVSPLCSEAAEVVSSEISPILLHGSVNGNGDLNRTFPILVAGTPSPKKRQPFHVFNKTREDNTETDREIDKSLVNPVCDERGEAGLSKSQSVVSGDKLKVSLKSHFSQGSAKSLAVGKAPMTTIVRTQHLAAGSKLIKFASCPVCCSTVEISKMNIHLDRCLLVQPGGSDGPESLASSKASVQERREPLSKVVYSLLKDAQVKKLLRECKLSEAGDRKTWIQRHQRYVVLYNAECDSLNPRPVQDVIQQLENEEKAKEKEVKRRNVFSGRPETSFGGSSSASGSSCDAPVTSSSTVFTKLLKDLETRGYKPKSGVTGESSEMRVTETGGVERGGYPGEVSVEDFEALPEDFDLFEDEWRLSPLGDVKQQESVKVDDSKSADEASDPVISEVSQIESISQQGESSSTEETSTSIQPSTPGRDDRPTRSSSDLSLTLTLQLLPTCSELANSANSNESSLLNPDSNLSTNEGESNEGSSVGASFLSVNEKNRQEVSQSSGLQSEATCSPGASCLAGKELTPQQEEALPSLSNNDAVKSVSAEKASIGRHSESDEDWFRELEDVFHVSNEGTTISDNLEASTLSIKMADSAKKRKQRTIKRRLAAGDAKCQRTQCNSSSTKRPRLQEVAAGEEQFVSGHHLDSHIDSPIEDVVVCDAVNLRRSVRSRKKTARTLEST